MTWRMVSKRSIRNIQFGLLLVSAIWGLDYLLPPTEPGVVTEYIEQKAFFSVQTWGSVMLVAGLVGLTCECFLARDKVRFRKLWVGSWAAHAIFAATFLMLAVGSFFATVIVREGWAGFRTPALWILIAAMHAAYARKLDNPVPRPIIGLNKNVG